jgi:molybdenum-dependent DNA-binding transcriptional regulator ModE
MSSVNVEYLQSVLKGLAEAGSKLTADHNDLIERFNHLSRAVDTLIQNDKINDQRFEAQNKAMMEMQQRVQKMELFL